MTLDFGHSVIYIVNMMSPATDPLLAITSVSAFSFVLINLEICYIVQIHEPHRIEILQFSDKAMVRCDEKKSGITLRCNRCNIARSNLLDMITNRYKEALDKFAGKEMPDVDEMLTFEELSQHWSV